MTRVSPSWRSAAARASSTAPAGSWSPPVHQTLVIHPVAFLFADDRSRWGALDRRGRPLIDADAPEPHGVTDEIDRLLADTRPVL